MAADIKNIKEKKPTPETVALLEKILKRAKTGDVKSVICVTGYNDDSVCHSWSIDRETSARKLLAEVMLMQHDVIVDIGLFEGDSVLAEKLKEDY